MFNLKDAQELLEGLGVKVNWDAGLIPILVDYGFPALAIGILVYAFRDELFRRNRQVESDSSNVDPSETVQESWGLPYEDAIQLIRKKYTWGKNKNWDWIRSDLWELVQDGRLSLGVSPYRSGKLESIPPDVVKNGFAEVQNNGRPGVIHVFGRGGHEDVYWYKPSFKRSEIDAEYSNRQIYQLQSEIPCDLSAQAAIEYILNRSLWGKGNSETDALERLRGYGVSGEILISTLHRNRRVYWYSEELKGMAFVRDGDRLTLRSQITDEVFPSPMFNRQQVYDLFPDRQVSFDGPPIADRSAEVAIIDIRETFPSWSSVSRDDIAMALTKGAIGGWLTMWARPHLRSGPVKIVGKKYRDYVLTWERFGIYPVVIHRSGELAGAAHCPHDPEDRGWLGYYTDPEFCWAEIVARLGTPEQYGLREATADADRAVRVQPSKRVEYNWTLQQAMLFVFEETNFCSGVTVTPADHYVGQAGDMIRDAIEKELTQRAALSDPQVIHVRAVKQAGEVLVNVPPDEFSTFSFCLCNPEYSDWTKGDYDGMIVRPVRKSHYRNDILAKSQVVTDAETPNEYWSGVKLSEQEVKGQDWNPKPSTSQTSDSENGPNHR